MMVEQEKQIQEHLADGWKVCDVDGGAVKMCKGDFPNTAYIFIKSNGEVVLW